MSKRIIGEGNKNGGLSDERPPAHELDLFDRYARGNPPEEYSKGWQWAQKLLGHIKKKERREAWDEGAEAMVEWFAGPDTSNPPENPYPVEPS